MDTEEDYDSDSTVIITDLDKNPEKNARKRRKLDERIRKMSDANDADNKANIPRNNLPIQAKEDRNNTETKQLRIDQLLKDNDSIEDLKVKQELLKQENYSEEREGNDEIDDRVVDKDIITISDDSDDDCTIVTNDTSKQVDKNANPNPRIGVFDDTSKQVDNISNLKPRIGVLAPSAINARRATLDSFMRKETAANSDSVKSANPSKVNPKLIILKPSAINSRRATLNSFEINEATSKFSSGSNNKESNNNKQNANNQENETRRLSGHKNHGNEPLNLATPKPDKISRKRNSDGVIQGKHKNLPAENVNTFPKNIDVNKKVAAATKIAKENKPTHSSSVIVRTADFLDKNAKDVNENQGKVDRSVNINDRNKTNADYNKTAQVNTVGNVPKDVTVTKIKDNSNVNEGEDASNQTKNSSNISEKTVSDGSKKEKKDASNKSDDATRIPVDRQTFTNVSCNTVANNTNTAENPILQVLKNNLKQNIVEDIGVSDDSAKANEELTNISESEVLRNAAEIKTPSKEDLCNTVTRSNSSEHALKDKTEGCSKGDEEIKNLAYEQRRVVDQENNLSRNSGIDNKENETRDKVHERAIKFQISFFKDVKQYLRTISTNVKLVSKLRASVHILKKEIKQVIRNTKKYGASKVQYPCIKCSQISVYSLEAMHRIGDDNNPILENDTLKCKSCRGLQILYSRNKELYLQSVFTKSGINTDVSRRESASEINSTENDAAINRNHSNVILIVGSSSNTSVASNEEENSVVDSLAEINHPKAPANNNVPNKTSQNHTSSIETSVSYENNELTSNDKTKPNKRTIDDNVSPIKLKRAKNDTNIRDDSTNIVEGNCQTKLNSTTDSNGSLLKEPTEFNNSNSKIIINSVITLNAVSLPRYSDETESREEKKANLTRTLVERFTKYQTKENYENPKTANEHTCPECTCVFGSHTALIGHMSDDHNIPENLNRMTCPLCHVHLNESNYMTHVKYHFPDEYTEIVRNETTAGVTNSDRNVNTTDTNNTREQNEPQTTKAGGGKQYECKICKKVLYSISAKNKHRKQEHGHLDLTNKKLFTVPKKKGGLKSVHNQSSARLEKAVSEGNSTAGNQEKIANVETDKLGSHEINEEKREKSENNDINNVDVTTQSIVDKGSDNENINNSKEVENVAQKNNKEERKRKASNEYMNIIQDAKQANLEKSRGETEITEHDNKDNSSQSHSTDNAQDTIRYKSDTKLHESSKDDYTIVKQSHSPIGNVNLPVNAEMVSEPFLLHESNTQGDTSVAKHINQTEADDIGKVGEINDINMDAEDSIKKSTAEDSNPENSSIGESNIPGADNSQDVEDNYTHVEDEIGGEQEKAKFIFSVTLEGKSILANCYNCQTNIDLNDINDHDCRQKIVGIIYNCYTCGVSVPQDGTHECDTKNIDCIKNIQITKVVTVKEAFAFKCEDCNSASDIYDDVIRHCQNHYNGIKDLISFCEICQLSYDKNYFKMHKHLHEKDIKIINYSYKSLFSNWDTIFQDMPLDVVQELKAHSIYTSRCVKMRILKEGPWQYSLYRCNQCETCIPSGKVDQHCRKQCYSIAYPCSTCQKLFTSSLLRKHHEKEHKSTEIFRVIEFNCKKDEHFNLNLFNARKIAIESRMPLADIFKCVCGLYFLTNESFRKHFVDCNLEDKGILCPRCAIPRFFEANELENHLNLHHSRVVYRFRVNRIVVQQDMEAVDDLGLDVGTGEDDVKRECFEEDNCKRRVA